MFPASCEEEKLIPNFGNKKPDILPGYRLDGKEANLSRSITYSDFAGRTVRPAGPAYRRPVAADGLLAALLLAALLAAVSDFRASGGSLDKRF
jgi:hypothetical protein